MKKKSVIYMIVVGLILSIGVSYAYFTGVIKGTGNKFRVSAKELKIVFTDNNEIVDNEITPGWSVTKTFTVKNESNNDFNYNITIDNFINTFKTEGYLQYKITSTNGFNMEEYKDIPKSEEEIETLVLKYDIDIKNDEIQEYSIEFIYRDTEEDQSIDMGKEFGGTLGIKEGTVDPSVLYQVTLNVINGSVIDTNPKETIKRGSVEFNVEAIEGYTLGNNVECDSNAEGVIENGKVTVSNVTENTICTLNSDIKEYTVNISVENGSSNEIDRKVSHGDNTTFTIEPDTGYTLNGAIITGNKCSIENGIIKLSDVRSNDDTCVVTLAKEKYKVYLSGNINVTSPIEVSYLESGTFNITPQEGYEIENTNINCDNGGIASREGNVVTVSNITKETICEISTRQLKYNVTINVINGSGNETKEVTHGSYGEFSISASTGYNLNNPTIECTGSAEKSISGSVVKISNVTGSQTCTVTLKPNEYNLEVTSNNDNYGTVSPSSGTITYGSVVEINITPKEGYKYKENTCGVEPINNKITLNVSGNIKCQVIFEETIENQKYLYGKILADHKTVNTRTDFSTAFGTSTATTGVIYKESTWREDTTTSPNNNKDVYYFAGNVSDNWVSFAGYKWRIIRTNEDGGVRLLYAGNGTSGHIGASNNYAMSANNTMYVGYMYGTSDSLTNNRKNTKNSEIKKLVDEWYESHILTNYDKYVSRTAIYCNDRSTGSYSTSSMSYASSYRNNRPSYKCGQKSDGKMYSNASKADRFSASTASGGNGDLKYPIALMTKDEVIFSGGKNGETNKNVYYYLNSSGDSITGSSRWWTMSPESFGSTYHARMSVVFGEWESSDSSGILSLVEVWGDVLLVARPVLSLKSCVQVASGKGTIGSPYTVTISDACALLEN